MGCVPSMCACPDGRSHAVPCAPSRELDEGVHTFTRSRQPDIRSSLDSRAAGVVGSPLPSRFAPSSAGACGPDPRSRRRRAERCHSLSPWQRESPASSCAMTLGRRLPGGDCRCLGGTGASAAFWRWWWRTALHSGAKIPWRACARRFSASLLRRSQPLQAGTGSVGTAG